MTRFSTGTTYSDSLKIHYLCGCFGNVADDVFEDTRSVKLLTHIPYHTIPYHTIPYHCFISGNKAHINNTI